MQKMITVTIDTKMLAERSHDAFTLQEIDAVNDLLESGWNIEEWEFLTDDADEDGKVSLIALLSDDQLAGIDEEDYSYEQYTADETANDDDEETDSTVQ